MSSVDKITARLKRTGYLLRAVSLWRWGMYAAALFFLYASVFMAADLYFVYGGFYRLGWLVGLVVLFVGGFGFCVYKVWGRFRYMSLYRFLERGFDFGQRLAAVCEYASDREKYVYSPVIAEGLAEELERDERFVFARRKVLLDAVRFNVLVCVILLLSVLPVFYLFRDGYVLHVQRLFMPFSRSAELALFQWHVSKEYVTVEPGDSVMLYASGRGRVSGGAYVNIFNAEGEIAARKDAKVSSGAGESLSFAAEHVFASEGVFRYLFFVDGNASRTVDVFVGRVPVIEGVEVLLAGSGGDEVEYSFSGSMGSVRTAVNTRAKVCVRTRSIERAVEVFSRGRLAAKYVFDEYADVEFDYVAGGSGLLEIVVRNLNMPQVYSFCQVEFLTFEDDVEVAGAAGDDMMGESALYREEYLKRKRLIESSRRMEDEVEDVLGEARELVEEFENFRSGEYEQERVREEKILMLEAKRRDVQFRLEELSGDIERLGEKEGVENAAGLRAVADRLGDAAEELSKMKYRLELSVHRHGEDEQGGDEVSQEKPLLRESDPNQGYVIGQENPVYEQFYNTLSREDIMDAVGGGREVEGENEMRMNCGVAGGGGDLRNASVEDEFYRILSRLSAAGGDYGFR